MSQLRLWSAVLLCPLLSCASIPVAAGPSVSMSIGNADENTEASSTPAIEAEDPSDQSNPPVEMVDFASPLLMRHQAEFSAIHHGAALRVGASGPAVVALQAILLFWNYPIELDAVTGQFGEETAYAVYSYRLDMGLSERGEASMADEARTQGVFDAATLAALADRMAAKNYRMIEDIDVDRGVRFHVPKAADRALAIATLFPWEDLQAKAKDRGMEVALEEDASLDGQKAAWVSIRAYACVVASAVPDSSCR